jgi:hypothetical protein
VRVVPVTTLAEYREGPPLGVPWLVRAEGEPAIYALDVAPTPALEPTTSGLAAVPVRFITPSSSTQSEEVVGGCSSTAAPSLLVLLVTLFTRRRSASRRVGRG